LEQSSISEERGLKGSYIIMTAKEVAQYLRIPLRTVYKLSQEGKIPATKVGRHWRFRKDLLDKWFDRNGGFAKRVGM